MSTAEAQVGVNSNLQKQDLSNLDISNLTPLSPEVISRQATINIGTIGHVAHGKSTVVKAISGVQTVRFKNELERNITIKLERISHERMLALLKSPKLLREYEERVEARLRRFGNERHSLCDWRRSLSVESSMTGHSSRSKSTELSTSTSPSSGYESFNDNSAIPSRDKRRQTPLKRHLSDCKYENDEPHTPNSKRRKYEGGGGGVGGVTGNGGTNSSNNNKTKHQEYVIESINSLEAINGNPVFFVKWLNYPPEENTWETFENLSECNLLEAFIDKHYSLLKEPIGAIIKEIQAEIEVDQLCFNSNRINIDQLDKFEPLRLKTDLIMLAQFRVAKSRSIRQPEKIHKRLLDLLPMNHFYCKRKQQLHDLRVFQKRMNSVEHLAPVSIENSVDLDVPDVNFQYILESFPGARVKICTDPPIGCKCEDACKPLTRCCARMADNYFAYDKKGRLRIRTGEAIYECNSRCTCGVDCVNRVIQRGRTNALCLFKTANGCGWGVRTERPLCKGEYVCEYVGEIITSEEANERGKKYDAIGRTYLFDLDYNTTAESVYTIDAALYGNISHFINHSCDPNLAVFPFWIDNLDINMPRLAFFTLRPIKAGEELTFDYIRTDYQNLSEAQKVTCRCGASNCRKVLF